MTDHDPRIQTQRELEMSPCGHYIRTPVEHLSPEVKTASDAVFEDVPDLVERLNRIRKLIATVAAVTRESVEEWPLAKACCSPAPDRSGRQCDKPAGHDGDHWTYGGATKTWPRESVEEPTSSINHVHCAHCGRWVGNFAFIGTARCWECASKGAAVPTVQPASLEGRDGRIEPEHATALQIALLEQQARADKWELTCEAKDAQLTALQAEVERLRGQLAELAMDAQGDALDRGL